MTLGLRGPLFLVVSYLLCAPESHAQTPSPPPPPVGKVQDEVDFLQGRAGLAVGSGARALGMGGAFLARADDATAASWNPAGLSYLRLPEVSVVAARNGFSLTNRDRITNETNEDNRFVGYAPDFLSIACPFEAGRASGAAQVSFQRVFAFGGEQTKTRFDSQGDEVRFLLKGGRGFDVLALSVGLQSARSFRLGVTANRWFNGFTQTRERLLQRLSELSTTFDLSGWNFNLGMIWTPVQSLNVGLVGKTPFTADVELSRRRTDVQRDRTTQNSFTSKDVRLDFPGAFGAGLSWRPRSNLTISVDYTRSFWSEGRIHNYFTLPIAGVPAANEDDRNLFDTLSFPAINEARQTDTEQIRLGLEYVYVRGRLKIPLRAGYFNDRQFFRELDDGAPRFNGFTIGTGILGGPFLFDVAYVYESGEFVASPPFPQPSRSTANVRRLLVSSIYRRKGKP